MKKVKIYDAIMGSGKTYDAIQRMKNYLKTGVKFIYITPYKEEIKRIMKELEDEKVFTPLEYNDTSRRLVVVEDNIIDEQGNIDLNAEKSYKKLNKRRQFLKLASQGENIISSHALFMNLKKSDYDLFSDYILILDEVVTPINVINVGAKDIQILKEQELIKVDEKTNKVSFVMDDYNDPAFRRLKKSCINNTVFHLDKYFFVWIFPIEIFRDFKEVQVLTYLFKGSLLSAYFKMYNIEFDINSKDSLEKLKEIKKLLNIYNGKINQTTGLKTKFSKTWIGNLSKKEAKRITTSTSYIFKNVFKTKSNENSYTTFIISKPKLAGPGYSRQFLAINARATNNYAHIKSMAYLGNRFYKPQITNFFYERGIELDQDLWALSELIQWIWRGCIRNNEEMNLFVPSLRMRSLLNDWLDGKFLSLTNDKSYELKKVS